MSAPVEIDVLVAGAGGAGLAAALKASRDGCSVAVLEASEHFRLENNTSMSTAMVPAGGSRWQACAGIDDSPARFAEDVRRKTGGSADPVITEALTGVAPRLVEWLADDVGVPLELVTEFVYPGHSAPRCHSVSDRSGRTLLDHLLAAVRRDNAIVLVVPMRLESLALAEGGDRVTVTARSGDGAAEELTAGSVVLASGGFAANAELTRRWLPEIARARYHGGAASRGDALRIGTELHADLGYLDAYQGHGSLAVPHAIIVTWAIQLHGGIIVNGLGNRFADETQGYSEFARLVLGQPGGVGYVLLDKRIDRLCRPFADYQSLLENGAVRWADDLAGAAVIVGADPQVLTREIELLALNSANSSLDRFGRPPPPEPLRPPFGVIQVTGALFHTQGGVLVDGYARVLRGGQPIPGLYAAGGAAAGMSGHGPAGYLAGNGLLGALGLGFLAGGHVGGRVHRFGSGG